MDHRTAGVGASQSMSVRACLSEMHDAGSRRDGERFGDAALRAKKAGFDGVQIHGGHGYLVCEFASAYSNKRIDKYGGNLVNRMRFPVEIIQNIR